MRLHYQNIIRGVSNKRVSRFLIIEPPGGPFVGKGERVGMREDLVKRIAETVKIGQDSA